LYDFYVFSAEVFVLINLMRLFVLVLPFVISAINTTTIGQLTFNQSYTVIAA